MKRIFMLAGHPLFSQGLELLLRRDLGLELVGSEADIDRAIEGIRALQPDVAIIVAGDQHRDSSASVVRVLRESPRTTVIGLNLQESTISIYRGEQRVARGVEDLVAAIEQDGGSEQDGGPIGAVSASSRTDPGGV